MGQHRRLEGYNHDMMDRLAGLVASAQRHVSIPNVLTEASNHLGSGRQQLVSDAANALAHYISNLAEICQQSKDVVAMREYASLGLADAALFSLAGRFVAGGVTVVTQDFELYARLQRKGVDCINVFHWRTPEKYG